MRLVRVVSSMPIPGHLLGKLEEWLAKGAPSDGNWTVRLTNAEVIAVTMTLGDYLPEPPSWDRFELVSR